MLDFEGPAFHPVNVQAPPAWWRPQWRVNHLVYQGGNPMQRVGSLTGGGFIPQKSLAGHEAPSWQPYGTPITSAVGGGSLPSRPNFLQRLLGGFSTTQGS